MSFSFANFLMNQTNDHNGHFQTTVTGMSVEDGLELCKELEELCEQEYSFTIELWTCGGYTIYQQDYFKPSEHRLGHSSRMILGVNP